MSRPQIALLASLLVGGAAVLSSCSQQPKAAQAAPAAMMDMSGSKVTSITLAEFGKGKDAKKCPVSGDEIKAGEGKEVTLSSGKKIMLCCPGCKNAVEKAPEKYSALLY
ncbi:MAG: hypothetical protein J0L75_10925 [Spirochaetes bacterium]|nr:hypothetical protein [Spirochaetota bacterium]